MTADCIFCKIIAEIIPAKKIYEDDDFIAFHDIKPMAKVHFLIVPKLHVESLKQCVKPQIGSFINNFFALAAFGCQNSFCGFLAYFF